MKNVPYLRPKWSTFMPFFRPKLLKTTCCMLVFAESRKSNSAPVTPATSIPASLEDLRQKRRFAKSTDILRLSLSPAEHLPQLKLMRDNSSEQELEMKGEREGKFKGALRAMKRYVCIAFFHSRLSDDLIDSVRGFRLWRGNISFKSNFTDSSVEFQPSFLTLILLEYGRPRLAISFKKRIFNIMTIPVLNQIQFYMLFGQLKPMSFKWICSYLFSLLLPAILI